MQSTTNIHEKELEVLEYIHKGEETVRQRELAKIAGLSLGMTNEIIKRLVDKGLLKIQRINSRNIRYLVSPKGIDEISHRSFRFIKRTLRHVVVYREAVETIVHEVKSRGFDSLVLIGPSDLDFIVEYACQKESIVFLHGETKDVSGAFKLYSERYVPDLDSVDEGTMFLREYMEKDSP